MSAQCKADYVPRFDAIQKRIAARAAVRKICDRDLVKGVWRRAKGRCNALECVLAATRGGSRRMQPGHHRGGVSLMWRVAENGCRAAVALLLLSRLIMPSQAQTAAGASENWVAQLAGLQTPPELDVPALRQQALARVKAKADGAPL